MNKTKLYSVAEIQRALGGPEPNSPQPPSHEAVPDGERSSSSAAEAGSHRVDPQYEVMAARPRLHLVPKSYAGAPEPVPSRSVLPEPFVLAPASRARPPALPDFAEATPAGTSAFDLGTTRVLPVAELLARGKAIQQASAPPGASGSIPAPPQLSEVLAQAGAHQAPQRAARQLEPLGACTRFALAKLGGARLSRRQRGLIVAAIGLLTVTGVSTGLALLSASPGPERATTRPSTASRPDRNYKLLSKAAQAAQRAAPLRGSANLPLKLAPGMTLERAAADAGAEGRYQVAVELYEELFRLHPDKPVFREAARVLARRLKDASR
ncbi:MAG TPA: hypothetical protein VFQ61_24910 [Polyangiaceae bacterium]|nr:hypothetical protein [Polyangiaceae bacterium]